MMIDPSEAVVSMTGFGPPYALRSPVVWDSYSGEWVPARTQRVSNGVIIYPVDPALQDGRLTAYVEFVPTSGWRIDTGEVPDPDPLTW